MAGVFQKGMRASFFFCIFKTVRCPRNIFLCTYTVKNTHNARSKVFVYLFITKLKTARAVESGPNKDESPH